MNPAHLHEPSAIRPRALLTAIAALGVLTGLAWHARGPAGWERPIIFVLRHEPIPLSRAIVLAWQPAPFAVATLVLAWLASRSGRVQLACTGAGGCFLATTVTERFLKPLVSRHAFHAGSPMFPSGHVTAAAAWAMFAWLVVGPRLPVRSALIVVPLAVSWAVIAAGDHYPADAAAGLLVGGLVVYGFVVAVERVRAAIAADAPVARSERLAPSAR